jgi:hypothetical protein
MRTKFLMLMALIVLVIPGFLNSASESPRKHVVSITLDDGVFVGCGKQIDRN